MCSENIKNSLWSVIETKWKSKDVFLTCGCETSTYWIIFQINISLKEKNIFSFFSSLIPFTCQSLITLISTITYKYFINTLCHRADHPTSGDGHWSFPVGVFIQPQPIHRRLSHVTCLGQWKMSRKTLCV